MFRLEDEKSFWQSTAAKFFGAVAIVIAIATGVFWVAHRIHTHAPPPPPQGSQQGASNSAYANGKGNENNAGANPQPEAKLLLTQPGDTLWALAKDVLKTTDWRQWYKYNPGLPQDPKRFPALVFIKVPAEFAMNIPSGRHTLPFSMLASDPQTAKGTASLQPSSAHADQKARIGARKAAATALATLKRFANSHRKDIATESAEVDLTLDGQDQPQDSLPLEAAAIIAVPATATVAAASAAVITDRTAPPSAKMETVSLRTTRPSPDSTVMPRNERVRNKKGKVAAYSMPVPTDMGLVQPNKPLSTLRVIRHANGSFSQQWLKNSRIVVKDKKFILYVPIQEIPSEPYMLFVGGLPRPISGAEFTENARPAQHMPGSHNFFRKMLVGGGAAGMGAKAFMLGAAPELAGGIAGGILLVQWIADRHQHKLDDNLKAAESQYIGAQLRLTADNVNPSPHQGRAP